MQISVVFHVEHCKCITGQIYTWNTCIILLAVTGLLLSLSFPQIRPNLFNLIAGEKFSFALFPIFCPNLTDIKFADGLVNNIAKSILVGDGSFKNDGFFKIADRSPILVRESSHAALVGIGGSWGKYRNGREIATPCISYGLFRWQDFSFGSNRNMNVMCDYVPIIPYRNIDNIWKGDAWIIGDIYYSSLSANNLLSRQSGLLLNFAKGVLGGLSRVS